MNEKYWFARGYYDGRTDGVGDDELMDTLPDHLRIEYEDGFAIGITDYSTELYTSEEQ